MTAFLTASDLAGRLSLVADRLDAADLVPLSLDVSKWSIGVQLDTETAVDRACELFTDAEPDDQESTGYIRTAFLDDVVTVRIHSPRTTARCRCGQRCNHGAVA